MATLCVRDMPAPLYADLERWAAESGRPISAEVLYLLEQEAARREHRDDWWRKVQALKAELAPLPHGLRAEDIIRDDRDHGHRF